METFELTTLIISKLTNAKCKMFFCELKFELHFDLPRGFRRRRQWALGRVLSWWHGERGVGGGILARQIRWLLGTLVGAGADHQARIGTRCSSLHLVWIWSSKPRFWKKTIALNGWILGLWQRLNMNSLNCKEIFFSVYILKLLDMM